MQNEHTQIVALVVVMITLMAFVAWFSMIMTGSRLQKKSRRLQGLVWLETLRNLLSLIQQHRGITNGILCGDDKLKTRLPRLKNDIHDTLSQLRAIDDAVQEKSSWRQVDQGWTELDRAFSGMTPKDNLSKHNLSKHNALILSLLFVIDDCAQHYRLGEMKDENAQSIKILWQEWLVATEHIGQARAIGTGVAAQKLCSSVDRIRLKYLHQSIKAFVQQSRGQNYREITQLLNIIEQRIVVDKPDIKASDYFDTATKALDEVFQLFDGKVSQLKQQVDANGAIRSIS
ncbi:hypothetical protein [Vibrio hippocampi]|uniref:Nitrate/nitrite sensing protein domain-containing protein n=1 Tax=Vibrio hippocampi TaxID=654686 RepID=A0ABN8DIK9_9VIBR|nr:hypothetical protein [Vibrio hippocampi]CAH0528920.1 hypothetical protein VHP8226_02950 [Vibrio hippocampi]